MGVSFDYTSSVLLCAEDNSSILDFDDDDNGELGGDEDAKGKDAIFEERCDLFGDSSMSSPLLSEESLKLMIERECELLPRGDYGKRLINGELDISVRRDAIDWIIKVNARYNFGPLSAYLSINYLDRFLSAYELPRGKAWMAHLLSVACLSIAAKMEEADVPQIVDLQAGEAKYFFEARTLQRVELLVLGTLEWRMKAMTPFSFIDYFLHKFNNGDFHMMSLVAHASQLIMSSAKGINILEFRPSEIAAAVALVTLKEIQLVEVDKALADCIYVEKERVLKCYGVIQEMAMIKRDHSAPSVPQSPIGVLDASFSCKSDETTQLSSQITSPAAKRRKL